MTPPFHNRRSVLIAALAAHAPMGWAQDTDQPDIASIHLPGSAIELQFAPRFDARFQAAAKAWVQQCAQVVADYLGRFPVAQLEVLLTPQDGSGVANGVSFGDPSALIRVRVGKSTTAQQFAQDWVLVHEMLHLAVPQLRRPHRWLHEGLATYCEGAARTRAGLVSPEQLWGGLVKGMPQGLPQAGDGGLDRTPTWGRTYWGGALFCLQADIGLRQQSGGRVGLREALQGVLTAGGNYTVAWPVSRFLEVADAVAGADTLQSLYARHKDSALTTDLAALWQQLGVTLTAAGAVRLNDSAPLAAVRKSIES